jgi:AAA15 family ATPase/GTPase
MLIEFSVENFKSFRERQTFSMVAAPRLRKKENVFFPIVEGEKFPALLKVAAIYGPNASGKSSLLEALALAYILANQDFASGKPLPANPFRFDKSLSMKPTKVEYHFIAERCRYQFILAFDDNRVVEESLIAFPRGREQLIYERKFLDGSEFYRTDFLEGPVELHNAWKKLTPSRALFLNQAVVNSSDDQQQLRIPLAWIKALLPLSDQLDFLGRSTQYLAYKSKHMHIDMASYLRDIDVPVKEIKSKSLSNELKEYPDAKSQFEEEFASAVNGDTKFKTTLTHYTELGEAEFDYQEESKGTRSLLSFYLPWKLMPNHLVLVDEMDSSLHPKLVADLVKKHLQQSSTGQLIFTTHDTHLMDTKLLRRDQVWLTERNRYGATELHSIYDFAGRDDEDIEKRYYEGRYRGLPILKEN